jgi:hypothetical protein
MVQKRKRDTKPTRPKTREKAIQWITKHARIKDLCQIVSDSRRKWKRTELLHFVKFGHIWSLDQMLTIYDYHYQCKEEQSNKLKKITTERLETKIAWDYLCAFIEPETKTVAVCKPVVFYSWKHANSGPGKYLVSHFGKEKSKYATVKMEGEIFEVTKNMGWRDHENKKYLRFVNIKPCHTVTLEYAVQPTQQDGVSVSWENDSLTPDNVFETRFMFMDKSNSEDLNYEFKLSHDKLNVTWSGTFLVAQYWLEHYIPWTLQMEIARFLF